MSTKAVAYIRVSTSKQTEKGLSLEAQQAQIEAYALALGIEIVEVVVDAGESAKTLNRTGLQRALSILKGKKPAADTLIVTKLDRLTRSVRDLGELVDTFFSKKTALLSVSDNIDTRTAAGRMVINMLGTVAQWEREAIGERTKDALAQKRARGEYAGGRVRFGFRVDAGQVVHHEREQAIIRRAKQLRTEGLSLRRIAATLKTDGHCSRAGTGFFAPQILKMLAAA